MVTWLTWVTNAVYVLASIAVLRLWFRHRSPAGAWVLGTFVVFDIVIAVSYLPETAIDDGLPLRLLVAVLMVSPYLLFRFADAVVDGARWLRRVADALVTAVVVLTFALPRLPDGETAMSAVEGTWFALALLTWGVLDVLAGWLLFRASVGEPGVVRNRLRVLAVAAIGLGLYIPASSATQDPSLAVEVVTQLVAAGLGLLFLVGFAPPGLLRAAWRDPDERRLYETAIGLMGAETSDDVAAVVVPGARVLMGAPSVSMRSSSGREMARVGQDPGTLRSVRGVVTREVGGTTLELVVTPAMPLFGADEDQHLDRLVLLAELALDRVRLLQADREARADVERLNAELESFVYTTSHDLKNPVIALIGYLEVLSEDHGHVFTGELAHILDRLHVNARHMDALIRDLLELSRVGRVDVTPEAVDLDLLVEDIARDLVTRHPGLRVEHTSLPTLWMNGTRARQVLTNLLDNSAAYGGRDDVTVSVSAQPLEDGGVRIVVADDGVGIPDEHLQRVFEVFERLDPERPGGTGMGLSICQRVVQQLGGEMRAVPSSSGARFHLDLPAEAVARPDPTPVPVPPPTLDAASSPAFLEGSAP